MLGQRRLRPYAIAVVLGTWLSLPANGQTPSIAQNPRGSISGEVVDADALRPLNGATVVLLPAGASVLPPVVETGGSFASVARSVVTGELGVYRFTDLAFGDYQIRVQRVGYRPVTIDVQLRASDDARVSVGLTMAPIRLHALTVRADPKPPYGRMETATEHEAASRVGAAKLRQRLFLGTDVREVTHPDVVESVTLGTTDLFRALHRLPGVTTRDDDAAELWTRGSRPDQTRVYFDGLPVFGPLHALGAFAGISTHAIGGAFLLPGVRPASIGEGGAAVLDVRTRPAGSVGDFRGVAEIGTAARAHTTGARIALDRQARNGRSGWMLSGGRSLFDLWRGGTNDTYWYEAPAYFADLAGRADYDIGGGRRLELSGLWMRDLRSDDATSSFFAPRRYRWGSDVGRVSLSWPIAGLRSRHTLGASHFAAQIDTLAHPPFDTTFIAYGYGDNEIPMRSAVLYASLSGEFEPALAGGETPLWSFGYDVTARRVDFDGDARHVLFRVESERSTRTWRTPTVGLWVTRRWYAGERLVVEPGLRVDVGRAIASSGSLRPMPRLQARFALDSQTTVSAGVGRSYQYSQALGRIENGIQALMHPAPAWFGADDSTPALQADIATIGAERWMGGVWLVAANAYARRSAGYLVHDPTPGMLRDRGTVAEGTERATGVEFGVRKLGGRMTGSASYSYGVARTTARGFEFPSSQDRRHSVDVALLARLRRSVQFSSTFTYASGAPYTRLVALGWPTQQPSYISAPADSVAADWPNRARKPAFASLDLALDWSFTIYGVRAATFMQLRNVLMRDNPGIYYGASTCSDCPDGFFTNRRDDVPLLPVIGLRARF